ncbi:hypothetical protein [Azospirillum argentinense]|uniref:Uncharacterized protein n=1 Tax=Azospirillum brasilense TaxID=192 RepID=A0A4D8Q9B8_AZOBR|nr:hypothetical protein [Azospirillum argentinense]QCO04480.1 hypothetical protein D3867_21380 [Azospirillum argentinense]
MPRTVLNIAAGYIPLFASDFDRCGVTRLINFDPLDQSEATLALQAALNCLVGDVQNVQGPPEVEYFTVRQDTIQAIGNDRIDLTMSVSPYGFAVVDEWNDALMNVGSYVMVFGNQANTFITQDRAFTVAVRNKYQELSEGLVDGLEDWLGEIASHVLWGYSSYRTALHGNTALQLCKIFKKIQ